MSNSDSKNFDYKAFYEWWCKQTSLVRTCQRVVRGKTSKLVEEKLYIRKDQKELYEKKKGVKLERKERYEKQSLFE